VPEPRDTPETEGGDTLLTTGEMARCSNNTLRTVRFYEEEGILRPIRRTEGGHRLFGKNELDRLMLVTDLRAAGLSLDEIKQILTVRETAATGGDAAKQAISLVSSKIEELREKLRVLNRLQEDLLKSADVMNACIDCHETRLPQGCETCSTIQAVPNVPRSMRVIWALNGNGGHGRNGTNG
jgi:MerR family Zn(II)-responsive transcriptional regulator of zntA